MLRSEPRSSPRGRLLCASIRSISVRSVAPSSLVGARAAAVPVPVRLPTSRRVPAPRRVLCARCAPRCIRAALRFPLPSAGPTRLRGRSAAAVR
eukprot:5686038-Pleurochrysis_carterae.AAC.1